MSVAGAVQKGPFLVGSTVLVNQLTAIGAPTNSTLVTEIEDSIGTFSFDTTTPGPVQIVASGYYFNELTGQPSAGTLTLKALYQVSNDATQHAYVNIMTHLINDRVLDLLATPNTALGAAIAQAEGEFISAFSAALPVADIDTFSALSLYNPDGASVSGNAYLLALSTAFYKFASLRSQQFGTAPDAELTLILNEIADDLADDGQVQTPDFLDEFVAAVRSLDPRTIIANLRQRSIVDYPAGLDVPDISAFLNLCAGTSECAWRAGAPMPTPAFSTASAAHDGKIYVFGGVSGAPSVLNLTQQYDPATNQWTSKAPMPVASHNLAAHTIGAHIYVLAAYGGIGFMNQLWRYDPVANTWETRNPKPTYRYEFASAVLAGRIYVLGGDGTVDNGPWESGKPWELKTLVEIYDPVADSWSTGQPAPFAFSSVATCVAAGEIFIFGGRANPNRSVQAFTLAFNPGSNSWSTKAPMELAADGLSCVSAGEDFYVVAGRGNEGAVNLVRRYDPATDAWLPSSTRLPSSRYWATAAVVDEEMFVFGGNGMDNDVLDSVEIFDLAQ
jgi:N-acetylneuraminic acid mutarotase